MYGVKQQEKDSIYVFFYKTTPNLKNEQQKYIKLGKPPGTVPEGELGLDIKITGHVSVEKVLMCGELQPA